MKPPRKQRLDNFLVEHDLVASRERARALILAGHVSVNGVVVSKAGAQVAPDSNVVLSKTDHPYVSRGALKLEAALDGFSVDPRGMTCLDIGASTGGFTDLLLRRGAARVFAIDVGYGQLAWSLRQDPRVVVLERQNIRYLEPEIIPETCDLAVIDVSFISLTKVLARVAEILGDPGRKPVICLVKPQFEVGKEQVGKGGVVWDEPARLGAVEKIRQWASEHRFAVGSTVTSPAPGPSGNIEYLLLLHTPEWPTA